MNKIKNKKAVWKRLRITGSGKVKRRCAFTSHLAQNKTTKQKKHLSKTKFLSTGDKKRLKRIIKR